MDPKETTTEHKKSSTGHHTGSRGSSAAGMGSPLDTGYDYDPRTIKYNPATGSGYSKKTATDITGPPPLPRRDAEEKGYTGATYSQVPSSGFGQGEGEGPQAEDSKASQFAGRAASGVHGIWSGIHVRANKNCRMCAWSWVTDFLVVMHIIYI